MAEQQSEKPRRRLPFWLLPLWWATVLAVLVLLLTYLAPKADPARWWPLGVLAMAYPYLLVLHVAITLLWLVLRPRRALLPIVAVLIGYSHVGDHVKLFGRGHAPDDVMGEPFKLLSWNVRLFDLYNWSGNKATRDSIFRVIGREAPQVLCLQEYFVSGHRRAFPTGDDIRSGLGLPHAHEVFNKRTRNGFAFGIATFSSHPIVARGRVEFPEKRENLCIWTDLRIGEDTLRVYNAHLASYHFGDKEHSFLAAIDTLRDRDELERGGRRIIRLLRRGFELRADETGRIAAHMAESPHPVVFCGDLNDVPMSHGYRTLRGDLKDAFRESGRGTGGTYLGPLPSFRIDHVLHSPALASWAFRTLPEELSDHRALTCSLAVRQR